MGGGPRGDLNNPDSAQLPPHHQTLEQLQKSLPPSARRTPQRLFVLTEPAYRRLTASSPISHPAGGQTPPPAPPPSPVERAVPNPQPPAQTERSVSEPAVEADPAGSIVADQSVGPSVNPPPPPSPVKPARAPPPPPAVRTLPKAFQTVGGVLYLGLSGIPELTAVKAAAPSTHPDRRPEAEEEEEERLNESTPAGALLRWSGTALPADLTLGSLLRALAVPYTLPERPLPRRLLIGLLQRGLTPHNHLLGQLDASGRKLIRPKWRRFIPL